MPQNWEVTSRATSWSGTNAADDFSVIAARAKEIREAEAAAALAKSLEDRSVPCTTCLGKGWDGYGKVCQTCFNPSRKPKP